MLPLVWISRATSPSLPSHVIGPGSLSHNDFRSESLIAALMSLELMVNAALINFVAFARYGGPHHAPGHAESGSLFALFAVAVTAAEMALALAIVIAVHRQRGHLDVRGLDGMHG